MPVRICRLRVAGLLRVQACIFAIHDTERGEYQQGQKAALDKACHGRFFKDVLPADKSLVMEIMCDPVKAFGDYPPRSGWEEFQWICHFGAEIYSLAANQNPSIEVSFPSPASLHSSVSPHLSVSQPSPRA